MTVSTTFTQRRSLRCHPIRHGPVPVLAVILSAVCWRGLRLHDFAPSPDAEEPMALVGEATDLVRRALRSIWCDHCGAHNGRKRHASRTWEAAAWAVMALKRPMIAKNKRYPKSRSSVSFPRPSKPLGANMAHSPNIQSCRKAAPFCTPVHR